MDCEKSSRGFTPNCHLEQRTAKKRWKNIRKHFTSHKNYEKWSDSWSYLQIRGKTSTWPSAVSCTNARCGCSAQYLEWDMTFMTFQVELEQHLAESQDKTRDRELREHGNRGTRGMESLDPRSHSLVVTAELSIFWDEEKLQTGMTNI